jgi:hypothetical protein
MAQDKLAQPEQEPVAWGVFDHNLHDMFFTEEDAQDMARLKGDGSIVRPLYTTPPQRTWVGLTDEELSILGEKFTHPDEGIDEVDFGMEIQRILKEKNSLQ